MHSVAGSIIKEFWNLISTDINVCPASTVTACVKYYAIDHFLKNANTPEAFKTLSSKIQTTPYYPEILRILKSIGSVCEKDIVLVDLLMSTIEDQNFLKAIVCFNNLLLLEKPNANFNFCSEIFFILMERGLTYDHRNFIKEALELITEDNRVPVINTVLSNLMKTPHQKNMSDRIDEGIVFCLELGGDMYMTTLLSKEEAAHVKDFAKQASLFHFSLLRGYPKTAKCLIEKKFDLKILKGWCPQHLMANSIQFYRWIPLWLKTYNNVNQKNFEGNTLLHMSKYEDDPQLANLLLTLEADVNVINNEGNTVLHDDHLQSPEVLIKVLPLFKQFKVKNIYGRTCLHQNFKNTEYFRLLMTKCDNLNTPSNMGVYPIHLQHHLSIIKMMRAHGAQLDVVDSMGQNAFHYIHDSDVYPYLIKRGLNLNQVNKLGETPLVTLIKKITESSKILKIDSLEYKLLSYISWLGAEIDDNSFKKMIEEMLDTKGLFVTNFLKERSGDISKTFQYLGNDSPFMLFDYVWISRPNCVGFILKEFRLDVLKFADFIESNFASNPNIYKDIQLVFDICPDEFEILNKIFLKVAIDRNDEELLDILLLQEILISPLEKKRLFFLAKSMECSLELMSYIVRTGAPLKPSYILEEVKNLAQALKSNEEVPGYDLTIAIISEAVKSFSSFQWYEINKEFLDSGYQIEDLVDIIARKEKDIFLSKAEYLWDKFINVSEHIILKMLKYNLDCSSRIEPLFLMGLNSGSKQILKALVKKFPDQICKEIIPPVYKKAVETNDLIKIDVLLGSCYTPQFPEIWSTLETGRFEVAKTIFMHRDVPITQDECRKVVLFLCQGDKDTEIFRKEALKAYLKNYPYLEVLINEMPLELFLETISAFLDWSKKENRLLAAKHVVPVESSASIFDLFHVTGEWNHFMLLAQGLTDYELAVSLDRYSETRLNNKWSKKFALDLINEKKSHYRQGLVDIALPVPIDLIKLKDDYLNLIERTRIPAAEQKKFRDIMMTIFAKIQKGVFPAGHPKEMKSRTTPRWNCHFQTMNPALILKDLFELISLMPEEEVNTYLSVLCKPTVLFSSFFHQLRQCAVNYLLTQSINLVFDPLIPGFMKEDELDLDGAPISIASVKNGLQFLMAHVKDRRPYTGTPEDETAEIESWYQKLEKALIIIAKKISLPDIDIMRRNRCISELGIVGNRCGVRWMNTAYIYKKIMEGNTEPELFANVLLEELREYRTITLRKYVPATSQNVHYFNQILSLVGHDLGIPDAEMFAGYTDNCVTTGFTKDSLMDRFKKDYNLEVQIKVIHKYISEMYADITRRDLFLSWVKQNIPVELQDDPDKFATFNNVLVFDTETGKIKECFIVYMMLKEGIIERNKFPDPLQNQPNVS